MFQSKRTISQSAPYDQAFFRDLFFELVRSGFTQITCLLPTNLVKPETRSLSSEAFLTFTDNIPGVLVKAQNPDNSEIIRLILSRSNYKVVFSDDKFPFFDSGVGLLHVESVDPARANGLSGYFHDYVKGKTSMFRRSAGNFAVLTILFLFIEVVSRTQGQFILQRALQIAPALDITLILAALIFTLIVIGRPSGLSLHPTRTPGEFLRNVIRGKFKDSPIQFLILTSLSALIGAVITLLITHYWLGK